MQSRTSLRCFGAIALISAVLGAASRASANVQAVFIDTGTPTDGVRTMNGWHGIVIRVVSDDGPISRVDFGSDFYTAGLFGAMAQRWTDPTAAGRFRSDTVQTSPGFSMADNFSPTVDNFDSHLLGDATHFVVTSAPDEAIYDFAFRRQFYQRTGIPSDQTIGYGASLPAPTFDPFSLVPAGKIWGAYDILPAYQTTTLDLAYIVTDSAFLSEPMITYTGNVTRSGGYYAIPEPSAGVVAGLVGVAIAKRRRRVQKLIAQSCRFRSTLRTDSSVAVQWSAGYCRPYETRWDRGGLKTAWAGAHPTAIVQRSRLLGMNHEKALHRNCRMLLPDIPLI